MGGVAAEWGCPSGWAVSPPPPELEALAGTLPPLPAAVVGRHGAGIVGVLNEVPAATEHRFSPPAVQCESQAPPDLLEEDGLARPVADVEELEMPIGELRGDQVDDDVKCAGQLSVRAGDEGQDFPRVVGAELGLDWSGGSQAVSRAPRRGTWPQRGWRG